MNKKILLYLFIILLLFTVTGCGNKKEDTTKKQKEVDESLFSIQNLSFHFDKDSEFKGLHYQVSNDFTEVVHDRYIQYNYYQEDGSNLFFFRIFYYENKDIQYAINDLGIEGDINLTDGKTDLIEYKYYPQPRDDGTIHFYFISRDNNLYVLHFASKYDIKDFETKLINRIYF